MSVVRRLALLVLALGAPAAALAAPVVEDGITVDVREEGGTVVIAVSFHVPVAPRQAWGVLTDFDGMHHILSSLESSRVIERSATRVVVEQVGHQREGPLELAFHTVSEVRLTPYVRMDSHLISGTFQRLDSYTTLEARDDGTDIVSYGECVTGQWIPPVVGVPLIRRATLRQYTEMRSTMLARAAAAR